MADYAGLAATANRLIEANGRTLTLRTFAPSGDAWNPTLTPTDSSVIGVVLKFSAAEVGDLVQADDKKILFSADVSPTAQDKIIDGSIVYSIVSVNEIKPGPTSVLYIVQARS